MARRKAPRMQRTRMLIPGMVISEFHRDHNDIRVPSLILSGTPIILSHKVCRGDRLRVDAAFGLSTLVAARIRRCRHGESGCSAGGLGPNGSMDASASSSGSWRSVGSTPTTRRYFYGLAQRDIVETPETGSHEFDAAPCRPLLISGFYSTPATASLRHEALREPSDGSRSGVVEFREASRPKTACRSAVRHAACHAG